nr:hypothetical protein B0A51_17650 [Rachicladosporium sp. CCFEE 5018]
MHYAGIPYIGRVHDIPFKHNWIKFKEWGDKYGPIYQSTLFGENHIWVMRESIAHEILGKRGAIYSDRPGIPAVPGSKSEGEYLPLLGFNDAWKRQRKFGHTILQAGNYHNSYHNLPAAESSRLLIKLLEEPLEYSHWLDQYTSRMICRLAYGFPDHSVDLKKNAFDLLFGISPSGRLPNLLPHLMYLPKQLNPWKIAEQKRHDWEKELYFGWRDQVKREMAEGTAKPSWMKTYYDAKEGSFGFGEHEAAYAVGMMALAGVQTIGSPLNTFMFAMVQYPEWYEKLQNEIDSVCGSRPPSMADAPRLPTLRAILKEGLRWRPPVPTGIPHESVEDDVWNGYFIPKGSHVHPLEWAMSRDPEVYPDAEEYKPDRWLDPKYPTYKEPLSAYPTIMNHHQFGFGRRICQGMELVDAELMTACGAIAWGLSLKKNDDLVPHPKGYTSLLITKPEPFGFELKPRSEQRAEQIYSMWRTAKKEDPQLVSKYDRRTAAWE